MSFLFKPREKCIKIKKNHKSLIKNSSCMFNSYFYSPQLHGSSPVLLEALRNYLIAVNTQIGLGMPGRKTQFSGIL
jgi:hypothetical protein